MGRPILPVFGKPRKKTTQIGASHNRATITEDTVREIRKRWKDGDRQVDIAKELGIKKGIVANVISKRSWSHVIMLLFLSIPCFAQTPQIPDGYKEWEGMLYYITREDATLAWDVVTAAQWYEARRVWLDPTPEITYDLGRVELDACNTTSCFKVIDNTRAGHFFYSVRSCNINPANSEDRCSEWADSTDAERARLMDGRQGAWRIFWRLMPPSDVVIE